MLTKRLFRAFARLSRACLHARTTTPTTPHKLADTPAHPPHTGVQGAAHVTAHEGTFAAGGHPDANTRPGVWATPFGRARPPSAAAPRRRGVPPPARTVARRKAANSRPPDGGTPLRTLPPASPGAPGASRRPRPQFFTNDGCCVLYYFFYHTRPPGRSFSSC